MEQVQTDIDNLRTSVYELKSSLYRADRAHARFEQERSGMSVGANIAATSLLALFFLLI